MSVNPFEAGPRELEALVAERAAGISPDLLGPFMVVGVSRGSDAVRCEVTARRLERVDAEDAAMADIAMALPVSGWIALAADGSVAGSSFSTPSPEEVREARTLSRDLLERGAVRGFPAASAGGPGRRPTHDLQRVAGGRRLLCRIGYDAD
jgi:hypothetical protein